METAKLHTPLENQERVFQKRHKNLREEKVEKSAKYVLHFSGFKNKDSTTPRLLAGQTRFPCPTTS